CIGQQRKPNVSAKELFGHDARLDHADKQKRRRHEFREGLVHNRAADRAPVSGHLQEGHRGGSSDATTRRWPISSTFRLTARRSRPSSGKLVKSLMRVSSAW